MAHETFAAASVGDGSERQMVEAVALSRVYGAKNHGVTAVRDLDLTVTAGDSG